MRYIFILLLLLNGSLLAWGMWTGGPENDRAGIVATVPDLPAGVARIELLEAGTGARPGPAGAAGLAPGAERTLSGRTPACFRLGPLFGGRRVQDLAGKIRASGAVVQLHAEEGELEQDYWVMVPPQGSRQEAQLRHQEFRARNVDSFVITQGAMANAISLGLFTQRDLAEEQLERLRVMGYSDAELRRIPREDQEIWLAIASWQLGPEDTPPWQALLTRPAERNWKQEPCREPLLSAIHELEFGAAAAR